MSTQFDTAERSLDRVVMSMSTGVTVPPGTDAVITSDALLHAWIIERLYISSVGTPGGERDWWLSSIRVDGREKLKKSISGAHFTMDEAWSDVCWKVPAKRRVVMIVKYVGKRRRGCPFFAAFVGSLAERERVPRKKKSGRRLGKSDRRLGKVGSK